MNSQHDRVSNLSVDIRPLDRDRERLALRECVIVLQDHLQRFDARMPAGEAIADDYITRVFERCTESAGEILIAATGAEVVGYVMLLTRVASEEVDEGHYEYGLIVDLFVRDQYRDRGIGGRLLAAAEAIALERGVRWLRIGALAANDGARNLYLGHGFSEFFVELEINLEVRRKPS